jgi:hypothetical protein
MVALARNTVLNVKLTNSGGSLQSSTPITLKNQVSEIKSIEDIRDVSEVEVVAGATLVYNSQNDKYEVRKITSEDIGTINLDGGSF